MRLLCRCCGKAGEAAAIAAAGYWLGRGTMRIIDFFEYMRASAIEYPQRFRRTSIRRSRILRHRRTSGHRVTQMEPMLPSTKIDEAL
jgi:hypothetical protein